MYPYGEMIVFTFILYFLQKYFIYEKFDKNEVYSPQNFLSSEYIFEEENLVDVFQFTFESDALNFTH